MILIKSPQEIEKMRTAGRIVALAHQAIAPLIKPGVTTKEIEAVADRVIKANGATPSFKGYGGYPASICTSVNQVLVHGIPSNTKLKEGDIISVDIGANYLGYHGDSAWTYAVGKISKQAEALLKVTHDSLFIGLENAKVGKRVGDISHAIQNYVEKHGFSIPKDYGGHGIGSNLHEEPFIPNFGTADSGVALRAGMVLAIEPMVHIGKDETEVLLDDWTVISKDGSLTAHYEHTVVITETGYEILTKL
jgi:methionyl aminopeptidase